MWALKVGFKVDRVFMDFILFIPLAFARPRAEGYIYIFYNNMVFYFFLKTSIIRYMVYLFFMARALWVFDVFLFWLYNLASLYKCAVVKYLSDDAHIISFRFAFVGF